MADTSPPRIRINKIVVAYLLVVHALAASAFFLPVPPYALPMALCVYVGIGLGTTVGLHRRICHHAFNCPRWVEYALVTVAMLTGQGSPLLWAATHRIHHAHADAAGDIHSPQRSFWYAHLGWILNEDSTGPDDWKTWCRDLVEHRYYHWLLRYRLGPQVLTVVVLGLVLGWKALPACFFLPMVSWMHSTYLVNSASHLPLLGRRPNTTRDQSTNVWWVSVLALGEGWHNNHHAYPASARHGWTWWQWDPGWIFIRLLEQLGLAWDVRVPTRRESEARPT